MLGIIDRRKRTVVSVSGTREQSSVQTKHEKCKSYLVARASWERYRTRIHGREQNTWRVSYVHWESVSAHGQWRVRVFASASSPSLISPRTDDTTAHARHLTSWPSPAFVFIHYFRLQSTRLADWQRTMSPRTVPSISGRCSSMENTATVFT